MTLPDSSSQAGTSGNQPDASAGQNAQPSSESVTITKAEWDVFTQRLQKLESGLQSDKDRAVRKTNERLDKLEGDLRPMLERALQHTASGKSADEALRLVQSENEDLQTKKALAEFAAAWKSGTLPAGFGAGNAQPQGVDMTRVLADYKLDPKDPYVASQMQGKTFANQTDAELFAARVFRDKQFSPDPNDAQSPATPGEGSQTNTDYNALSAEYEALSRDPAANFERMTAIQQELDKLT